MNKKLSHLIKVAETFAEASHEHYRRTGLTFVDVPSIVGITGACENVDTLFRVGSRTRIPLFFNQTGQLSLEQALQHVPGVYTVIHSGRDEEEEDARHLRQFRLTEEEFDWTLARKSVHAPYDEEQMYEALLGHIESAIRAIGSAIVKKHGALLADAYGRDPARLLADLAQPFHRVSYDEAVTLLSRNGFPEVRWGDDLTSAHEAKVVELLSGRESPRPVFIMRYPKDIKFFNMKVSKKDPRVVLSTDLILPFAGEAVGAAVREHDGPRLKERLVGSTMFRLHTERGGRLEDFGWYLDLVDSGSTKPHAGYGIGNERLIQYLLGLQDIREASVFHQMALQTKDWQMSAAAIAG
jgi:asparaginyl-tRNA synthetase